MGVGALEHYNYRFKNGWTSGYIFPGDYRMITNPTSHFFENDPGIRHHSRIVAVVLYVLSFVRLSSGIITINIKERVTYVKNDEIRTIDKVRKVYLNAQSCTAWIEARKKVEFQFTRQAEGNLGYTAEQIKERTERKVAFEKLDIQNQLKYLIDHYHTIACAAHEQMGTPFSIIIETIMTHVQVAKNRIDQIFEEVTKPFHQVFLNQLLSKPSILKIPDRAASALVTQLKGIADVGDWPVLGSKQNLILRKYPLDLRKIVIQGVVHILLRPEREAERKAARDYTPPELEHHFYRVEKGYLSNTVYFGDFRIPGNANKRYFLNDRGVRCHSKIVAFVLELLSYLRITSGIVVLDVRKRYLDKSGHTPVYRIIDKGELYLNAGNWKRWMAQRVREEFDLVLPETDYNHQPGLLEQVKERRDKFENMSDESQIRELIECYRTVSYRPDPNKNLMSHLVLTTLGSMCEFLNKLKDELTSAKPEDLTPLEVEVWNKMLTLKHQEIDGIISVIGHLIADLVETPTHTLYDRLTDPLEWRPLQDKDGTQVIKCPHQVWYVLCSEISERLKHAPAT